ncbi:hypothetical protein MNB_SUP05-SYMBIONT-4-626 [hydrothermal vent metagenome]|uniref:Uncharacterized protein n=1 Tax=hydrothermal vent metagenome TaxID=652676 RepID=A0A1W1DXB3_9ZZZZ
MSLFRLLQAQLTKYYTHLNNFPLVFFDSPFLSKKKSINNPKKHNQDSSQQPLKPDKTCLRKS